MDYEQMEIDITLESDRDLKENMQATAKFALGQIMEYQHPTKVKNRHAKHIVKFLAALEAENIDIIKKADSTSTFGWQSGKRFVPGHDKDIVLDIDPSQRGM